MRAPQVAARSRNVRFFRATIIAGQIINGKRIQV
jgi:hypothetical protein